MFGARTGSRGQLWIRRLDSLAAQPIPHTEQGATPFWSPDGRFIAFGVPGELRKVNLVGSPAVTITPLPNFALSGGSWSPTGVIVFGVGGNNQALYSVPAEVPL